jgi:hypothetical protein
MSNLTKLDHDEVRAGLSEKQHSLLEALTVQVGLPSPRDWTAVPGLLVCAKVMAADRLAAELVGKLIDENNPSLGRYTEEMAYSAAERLLLRDDAQPITPPRKSRTRAAWLRACQTMTG